MDNEGRMNGDSIDRTSKQRPTLREALTELLARCREVKAALDANIPDGEPVHPQSAALTWPMSSAGWALESPDETPSAPPSKEETPEGICKCGHPRWAHIDAVACQSSGCQCLCYIEKFIRVNSPHVCGDPISPPPFKNERCGCNRG